ncbi:MAG: hypothetical protein HRU12_25420, partial [Phaeodactylibacter sp.]|nr:hypothetical protein [Phaeodactylibacter sp.]
MSNEIITDEAIIEEVPSESGDQQLQRVEKVLPQNLTILPLQQRPVFPGL